jgi:hypothetical protein
MRISENVGKLMHLPLEDIELNQEFSAPEFLVNAVADSVLKAGGRNWIPLIVQETAEYQYRVVSHPLVYAVAKKAELERIWCIVINPQPSDIEQAKILAGAASPRVCLNTASRQMIESALEYLQETNGSVLKAVDMVKAAHRLADSQREYWEDFNEIPKLKCGITKGKKLDTLKEVFYLEPLPKPELPPAPEIISIKTASRDEVFERLSYLSTSKIDGFEKINPDETADIIFSAYKSKWKSLNPIAKLECDIRQIQIKTLKTVFKL